jgi:hypothetical protein
MNFLEMFASEKSRPVEKEVTFKTTKPDPNSMIKPTTKVNIINSVECHAANEIAVIDAELVALEKTKEELLMERSVHIKLLDIVNEYYEWRNSRKSSK